MKARHILLVNVFFAPFSYGGATVVAEQVAHALIRLTGCRITAVSLCHRGELAPYTVIKSESRGIVNYLINVPGGRRYTEMYDNPRITGIIERLMDQLEPDLVHVHCLQDMGIGALRAATKTGIPAVLSVHDFWWLCDRQFMIRPNQNYCGQSPVRIEACQGCVEDFDAARHRFETLRQQAQCAALVTYPSRFALGLSEASGFGPGRGVVWENGVMQPRPGFFRQQAARRASDPRVAFGFVGGPSQIKGWPMVRRVFETLNATGFRGYLADGSLDGRWWAGHDLSRLKGEWSVHERFSQDEMDTFYSKIDVLLFMSQWKETFGLAIREAVCRGIRVIQTDSGGTTEHKAVDPRALIPIGSTDHALRDQVLDALQADPSATSLCAVTSYDDQARQFAELIAPLMAVKHTARRLNSGAQRPALEHSGKNNAARSDMLPLSSEQKVGCVQIDQKNTRQQNRVSVAGVDAQVSADLS